MVAQRTRLLRRLRRFFETRGVTEVETPVLTRCGVSDVHIESIATAAPQAYLRTSPEYFHKRLLAGGFGDLFEIGPVFRRGESGRHHLEEFSLLEWYRVGWSWRALAEETVELVRTGLERAPATRFVSWQDSCLETLGADPLELDGKPLETLAPDAPEGLDRGQLLDWLFATRVQAAFAADSITVVHDYPAEQAALARLKPGQPQLAERFEVFFGPLELANGYRELTDPGEQRARFEADNRIRCRLGRTPMPIDERLVGALESGLPDCSGVALGIDRLLMAATGRRRIDEVVAFPSR
jgi:lysyl-tRNA synthetase class 2